MKKILSLILACVMIVPLTVGAGIAAAANGGASPTILYGVNAHDDGLSVIDPTTGAVSFIGELDPDPDIYVTPIAMAVQPSSGEIFVWNNSNGDGVGGVISTGVLLTVDRCTGLATPVGPTTPGQGQMSALAFAPDDTLYGFGMDSGQYYVYTISTSTGVRTQVGLTPIAHSERIAAADFNASGTLYGVNLNNSGPENLYTVNITDGSYTTVGALSVDIGTIGSIVFAADGTLIGSAMDYYDGTTPGQEILFDIEPADGTVSNIRQVSAENAPQGMGFASPLCVIKELGEDGFPDDNEDGIVEVPVGEEVDFVMVITVKNNSLTLPITDIVVKDRLGADLMWADAIPSAGDVTWGSNSNGKPKPNNSGQQDRLVWDNFSLDPGASATCTILAHTDLDPSGNQRYTETGIHYLNSGANVKCFYDGVKISDTSDPIMVEAVEPAG